MNGLSGLELSGIRTGTWRTARKRCHRADEHNDREWTLLIPSYTVILVLLTYFTYFSLAIHATPSFSEMSTITGQTFIFLCVRANTAHALAIDSYTHFFPTTDTNIYEGYASASALLESYDMPIGVVNRVLYSQKKPQPPFGGGTRR